MVRKTFQKKSAIPRRMPGKIRNDLRNTLVKPFGISRHDTLFFVGNQKVFIKNEPLSRSVNNSALLYSQNAFSVSSGRAKTEIIEALMRHGINLC